MNRRLSFALAMAAMALMPMSVGAVEVPDDEVHRSRFRSGPSAYVPKPMSPEKRAKREYVEMMNAKLSKRHRLPKKKPSQR